MSVWLAIIGMTVMKRVGPNEAQSSCLCMRLQVNLIDGESMDRMHKSPVPIHSHSTDETPAVPLHRCHTETGRCLSPAIQEKGNAKI